MQKIICVPRGSPQSHLPPFTWTAQVQRLLQKEGRAYVFNDLATLERVTRAIIF
ncbi:MAG: DUF6972 family protein [Elainellaceae cyanobacterium]